MLPAPAIGRPGIAITGIVGKTSFLGREAHCVVHTEAGEITAQLTDPGPDLLGSSGHTIDLVLPFDRLFLFRPDGSALTAGVSA